MWFRHVPVKNAGQVINNIVTNWAPAVLTDWEQRPAVGFAAAAVCVSKCITMPFGELIGCVFIRFRVPFFCCNASSTSRCETISFYGAICIVLSIYKNQHGCTDGDVR